MSRTPWRLGAAVVVALLGLAGLASPATAKPNFALTRTAGADRYATAAQLAAFAFPGGTDTAIIARGDQYAEALTGAYVAGIQTLGAPVLLSTPNAVPAATKASLQSLKVKNVIILGGTGAISTAAENDLKASYTVTRISGTNRYDTAAKVAQTTGGLAAGTYNNEKTAIMVNGESFPDALAAGPIAYAQRLPLLLTRSGDIPTETKTALEKLAIKHVIVVGGAALVGKAVTDDLTQMGISSEVLAGSNRYATAVAVANFELKNLSGWSTTTIALGTGESFADAVAAAPLAGKTLRPLLLTQSHTLSPDTANFLNLRAEFLDSGVLLGGSGSVDDSTKLLAEKAAGKS